MHYAGVILTRHISLKTFKMDYSVTKTEIPFPRSLALFSDSHSLSTYSGNVATGTRHKYTHTLVMFPPSEFMLPVTTGCVLDMSFLWS